MTDEQMNDPAGQTVACLLSAIQGLGELSDEQLATIDELLADASHELSVIAYAATRAHLNQIHCRTIRKAFA